MHARLTFAQLGQALGVTKQAISKLAKQGMPVTSVEAARAWRVQHLDAGRTKDARMAIDPPVPPAPRDAEQDDAPAPSDTAEYREHRARRERIRAEREQVELDRLRGSLVDVGEVARLRFTESRQLRDALGNVGARIKDACAAETDPLRVEDLINGEISAVLTTYCDDMLRRGVMQDSDDDDEDAGEADRQGAQGVG